MGMDVYGEAPITKKGEYFRNNCWYWRPLWDFVCRVCDDVLTEEDHLAGHYNDGYLIPVEKAIAISVRLSILLEQGKVIEFQKIYTAELDAMPTEPCQQCAGTGIRPNGREEFGEEWFKACNGCNGCHGKGQVKQIETWYPFEETNVREFAEFAKESGGFRIS